MDVGFLHETKLMQGIHTWNGTGYNVWAMEAEIRHREGVAVVWRAAKGRHVEGTASFGTNTVSFLLTYRERQW